MDINVKGQDMKKIIRNFWNGKITLWRSYWLVGELLNALFILLVFNLEIYFFGNIKGMFIYSLYIFINILVIAIYKISIIN